MLPNLAVAALLGALSGGQASAIPVQLFTCPPGYVHRLPDPRCYWVGRPGHPGRWGRMFLPRQNHGRPVPLPPRRPHHRSAPDGSTRT